MNQITLSGLEFSSAFHAALPEFERSLAAHDYDAADFVITKTERPLIAYTGNSEVTRYDYITRIHSESFTTTFSDDMQFLHNLANLCFAADAPQDASNVGIIRNVSVVEKISRLFHRAEHWLTDTN